MNCAPQERNSCTSTPVRSGRATSAEVVAANAYLGGHAITAGLRAGADVVHHRPRRRRRCRLGVGGVVARLELPTTSTQLAGATVAGHAIECGTQVTGGNFAFFDEVADLTEPGFPIAEIAHDGTSVITKPLGTGGAVTVDTVTAQLLYEIIGPRYPVPDVVARFDTRAAASTRDPTGSRSPAPAANPRPRTPRRC